MKLSSDKFANMMTKLETTFQELRNEAESAEEQKLLCKYEEVVQNALYFHAPDDV